jgi:hypothetical protein
MSWRIGSKRALPLGVFCFAGLALAAATGCSGAVDNSAGGSGKGGNDVGGGNGGNAGGGKAGAPAGGNAGTTALSDAPGVLPMRLLTRVEYDNTIFDLLGDNSHPAAAFPTEDAANTGFAQVQKLDEVNVNAYLKAAELIAEKAATDLKTFMGCDPAGANELACVKSFVTTFGRKAYRRPLTTSEVDEHVAFFRDTMRGTLKLPVNEAVVALTTAMLQSPFFLYRWEGAWAGTKDGSAVRLNPHHLASQLSYFLWASMPDAALSKAADDDQLKTSAQIEAQVQRLLSDPRAQRMVSNFIEQWLGVSALPGALRSKAGWNKELATAMVDEANRFAGDIILRGDGKMKTLFTSRQTSADGTLAAFYGDKTITGTVAKPLTFPDGQRAGILTLAAPLAAHSVESEPSPILRGKFIRERIMCDPLPPPPGGVPDLPPPDPNTAKKDRFAMHAKGSCAGCHKLMDPIGFGFENYDNVGAYRTMDGKFMVDSKGVITALDDKDQNFNSAIDMMTLLSESNQVRTCLIKQFFRYAVARKESDSDAQVLADALTSLTTSDSNIKKLLLNMATSKVLTHRSLAIGEVLP